MPTNKLMRVRDLTLDHSNFRIMRQVDEAHVLQAMISSRSEYFFALMESLLEDGYLPTENIIVLEIGGPSPAMVAKEGNRRVGALKLIHGYLACDDIPDAIAHKIANLPVGWKADNECVPCSIYEEKDAVIVDRIITLAHGKGEKAGRDQWSAIARARHNRDVNKASEPALDLLEKYLKGGKNLTPQQAYLWAGDFPLTVLDEAMKRIATRFGVVSAPELAKKYPVIPHRDALDGILLDIGLQSIRFETIRRKGMDFAAKYGVPPAATAGGRGHSDSQAGSTGAGAGASGQSASPVSGAGTTTAKPAAVAIQDPKAVKATLRKFRPLGNNRQKVVTLCNEALNLNLNKNPIAFCFLLRSMFEISAKAYCDDHKASGGPSATKTDGSDRRLVDVLRDVTNHLTTPANQKPDQAMLKTLHGAMTELARSDGILSVTSMNQLVHNPSFSVTARDICTLFGNIFPLLEAMNR